MTDEHTSGHDVPNETARSSPAAVPVGADILDDSWLRDFYKECGREVTLAYTMLNQMKNWGIVVLAAIISSVASFGRSPEGTAPIDATRHFAIAVVVGATLAYVFTLRFFVRAILCYINLLRWNTLQAAIVDLKLVPREGSSSAAAADEPSELKLRDAIRDHFHRWLATVPRKSQIASNLKLGFGPLFAISLLLLVWGLVVVWDESLVRGLAAFTLGATLIEAWDFYTSRFFDTPEDVRKREARKRAEGRRHTFPSPSGDLFYVMQWVVLLCISTIIAVWPWIDTALELWMKEP